jgi:hypothetical protein
MRVIFFIICSLVIGCSKSSSVPTSTQQNNTVENKISKAKLQRMFDNIATEGKWDMKGNMLWGYFFTDPDRNNLQVAAEKLKASGYRFVDIFQPEDDGKPLPYFFLHVERVETHSVDSLYKRNTELEQFARDNNLETYDGMDVGQVAAPPK